MEAAILGTMLDVQSQIGNVYKGVGALYRTKEISLLHDSRWTLPEGTKLDAEGRATLDTSPFPRTAQSVAGGSMVYTALDDIGKRYRQKFFAPKYGSLSKLSLIGLSYSGMVNTTFLVYARVYRDNNGSPGEQLGVMVHDPSTNGSSADTVRDIVLSGIVTGDEPLWLVVETAGPINASNCWSVRHQPDETATGSVLTTQSGELSSDSGSSWSQLIGRISGLTLYCNEYFLAGTASHEFTPAGLASWIKMVPHSDLPVNTGIVVDLINPVDDTVLQSNVGGEVDLSAYDTSQLTVVGVRVTLSRQDKDTGPPSFYHDVHWKAHAVFTGFPNNPVHNFPVTTEQSYTHLDVTGSGFLVCVRTNTSSTTFATDFYIQIDGKTPFRVYVGTTPQTVPLFPLRFESSLKITGTKAFNGLYHGALVILD